MTDNILTTIELTEESIESMVYEIRGQKVMLDFDLAKIYGYDTKYLNRQVQRNIEKFPEDFMFRLTEAELKNLERCQFGASRKSVNESEKSLWSKKSTLNKNAIESEESLWCQNVTLNKNGNKRGYNIKYLPYAFTEQGVYMLMTVLRGELAIKQSKALIRLFKRMKDYIVENKELSSYNASLINEKFSSYDKRFEKVEEKLEIVMDNFIDPSTYKHFLILDGQKIEADLAYQTIYSLAKRSIYIIDDYIGLKTLQLLKVCHSNIDIIIFSDNVSRNPITKELLDDFLKDTRLELSLRQTNGLSHDRYIFIDYGCNDEKLFSSGSSSKDAGNRATTIISIGDSKIYHPLIERLLLNEELMLK